MDKRQKIFYRRRKLISRLTELVTDLYVQKCQENPDIDYAEKMAETLGLGTDKRSIKNMLDQGSFDLNTISDLLVAMESDIDYNSIKIIDD